MFDIIVVGAGPAGMTAALYGLRNGKSVLIMEKFGFGGQITYSPKVENFPGFLQISGNEFADKFMEQLMAHGAEMELAEAVSVKRENGLMTVVTADGETFEGKTVILATGVKHRMLGLPGENELVGSGISFCAVCDGDFYKGQEICVAGGGNSALQEAILLSDKCRKVTVLQDLDRLTGEQKLQDILLSRENVNVKTGVKITGLKISGDELRGVETESTSGRETVPCTGLFVAIGLVPENDAFKALAETDSFGYFTSGEDCLTKTPGLFTAGDCRAKSVRQVTTAVGDGAVAAMAACNFINSMV